MVSFTYSTRPTDATLQAWVQTLEPKAVSFLREHPLQVPFWYHGYPGQYAAACLANDECRENCRLYPDIYTLEDYAKRPVFRMEFEMGVAIGGLEVLNWAKKKTWGPLDWIAPLLPDDPVHPMFLEFCHNPDKSIWHQKLMQKQWLKRKLGRGGAGLVHSTRASTLEDFVGRLTTGISCGRVSESSPMASETLDHAIRKKVVKVRSDGVKIYKCWWQVEPETDKAALIRQKLRMTPEEFWRACKCLVMLPRERIAGETQRELF